MINTLFKSKISRKSVQPTSEERIPKTIEIKSITHGEHGGGPGCGRCLKLAVGVLSQIPQVPDLRTHDTSGYIETLGQRWGARDAPRTPAGCGTECPIDN